MLIAGTRPSHGKSCDGLPGRPTIWRSEVAASYALWVGGGLGRSSRCRSVKTGGRRDLIWTVPARSTVGSSDGARRSAGRECAGRAITPEISRAHNPGGSASDDQSVDLLALVYLTWQPSATCRTSIWARTSDCPSCCQSPGPSHPAMSCNTGDANQVMADAVPPDGRRRSNQGLQRVGS